MAIMVEWEIFTGNGGKPGMGAAGGRGGCFIMGGMGEVPLHSWQRGANPLVLRRLPYIAYPPFFKLF